MEIITWNCINRYNTLSIVSGNKINPSVHGNSLDEIQRRLRAVQESQYEPDAYVHNVFPGNLNQALVSDHVTTKNNTPNNFKFSDHLFFLHVSLIMKT